MENIRVVKVEAGDKNGLRILIEVEAFSISKDVQSRHSSHNAGVLDRSNIQKVHLSPSTFQKQVFVISMILRTVLSQ